VEIFAYVSVTLSLADPWVVPSCWVNDYDSNVLTKGLTNHLCLSENKIDKMFCALWSPCGTPAPSREPQTHLRRTAGAPLGPPAIPRKRHADPQLVLVENQLPQLRRNCCRQPAAQQRALSCLFRSRSFPHWLTYAPTSVLWKMIPFACPIHLIFLSQTTANTQYFSEAFVHYVAHPLPRLGSGSGCIHAWAVLLQVHKCFLDFEISNTR